MEKSKLVKALLIASGIIGIFIGGSLLFVPVAFQASAGIDLEGNINLLSEVRAPGGTLLIAGILILSGAFMARLTYGSVLLTCLFYLSYGVSRVFSVIIDGMPSSSLIGATIIELVIGGASLYVLVYYRKKHKSV
ncbi:DUF4345 domain-containing protein [Flavivirga eckloniae]|uniref:DUF4345 domain-containing protein n=1 Tax=Flavivirga eckloniae TaxID=1803846 RepID=A0A2K9PND1_9FLAO|nr:DUF4345 domain-containing protein [Flavivirga eckloniae]AUP78573.1 DUF4345 domain-containing protein [Flavivirga eckloniae]